MLETVKCLECGHEIAYDDFVMEQCPICDGYMHQDRLALKAYPQYKKVIKAVYEPNKE